MKNLLSYSLVLIFIGIIVFLNPIKISEQSVTHNQNLGIDTTSREDKIINEEDNSKENEILDENNDIDDKGKEDIEFQMINQLQNNWADNLLSVINKLISFNYNLTQKEIIYLSVTVIIVMVIYFILFSAYQLIKPRYPPPQQFNIKLIKE